VILEIQKPKKVIGFSLQLVNDQDAKTIVSSLQSKHNLQFTIDTIHKIDYGYNFEKRKFQNFNTTYVNLIQKDNALYDIRQQLKRTFQKQISNKTMKQPYYQLDFSASSCKFQIKVNDIEILSMNLDGQTATDIPINAAVFGSGLQKIEVKGYPLDGTKILNPEAYIRYKIVEQNVENGQFMFVKGSEKYQTPKVKVGEPFIYHTTNFIAEVPYELQSWNTLRYIKDLKTDIKPFLIKAYQRLITKAKEGDYKPLIEVIKIVEARNSKTMYLSEQETKQRIKSILDDINDGFEIMDLEGDQVLSYAGNGKLVRLIRTDGNSALAFSNSKTSEELILDIWFCLPNGESDFVVF